MIEYASWYLIAIILQVIYCIPFLFGEAKAWLDHYIFMSVGLLAVSLLASIVREIRGSCQKSPGYYWHDNFISLPAVIWIIWFIVLLIKCYPRLMAGIAIVIIAFAIYQNVIGPIIEARRMRRIRKRRIKPYFAQRID